MIKYYVLFIALFITAIGFGQLKMNEVSYYTSPQFVEISGPINFTLTGSGWKLKFYKGNRQLFATEDLTGTMPATEEFTGEGKSLLAFNTSSLQYSSPPGGYVALLDPLNNVIQLFAYHGAKIREIDGVVPIDIGTAASGDSLQLTDTGWVSAPLTKGTTNLGQSTLPVIKNQIEGFSLYPNPVTSGRLYIKSNSMATKNVEIYSMLGQQVYAKSVQPNETIDIYSLNKGIYMVRIEEDGKIATRKLVIK